MKIITNMEDINPIIFIITLNVNGINKPIKRQKLRESIKKLVPNHMLTTRNPR